MRRVMCTICLIAVLLISGCNAYWYQPGKTLEQCVQDVIECKGEAKRSGLSPFQTGFLSTSPSPMQECYIACMRLKGYQSYHRKYLPTGVRAQYVIIKGYSSFNAAGRE